MLFFKQSLRCGQENHCFHSGLNCFFCYFVAAGYLGIPSPWPTQAVDASLPHSSGLSAPLPRDVCVQRDLCRLTCPDERAPRRQRKIRLAWSSLLWREPSPCALHLPGAARECCGQPGSRECALSKPSITLGRGSSRGVLASGRVLLRRVSASYVVIMRILVF